MSKKFISDVFVDFDQFRSSLSGWDVDVTQLGPGPLRLSWNAVVFDEQLIVSHLKSSQRLADRMAIENGYMKFVVCFTPNIFCGLDVAKGTMLIFGPGREYRSVLPAGFESFEIDASIDFLREMGLEIGDETFCNLNPENCVLEIAKADLEKFRLVSQTLVELTVRQSDETIDRSWANAARERAINLIVNVFQQSERTKVPSIPDQVSGWQLTARALLLIDEQRAKPSTVAEIATSLGCSTRALQTAFKSCLGITPLQYKLAHRLQFTRQALLSAKPSEKNVTEIATEFEFFHFGRFSQYYRGLFGESPSVTLKRVAQVHSGLR